MESLDTIRARAARHQDEIDRDVRFFTVRQLAKRWGISPTTVRDIPREQLPYLNLGRGLVRETRRYRPADVEAYEAFMAGEAPALPKQTRRGGVNAHARTHQRSA